MPEVSVIVPVFEVEAYLGECLDSIFSQDFQDFEVIAINDASPDGSLQILRRYERSDTRIMVIDLPENMGLGAARNVGLDAATGKYVLFLDSDDAIRPGSLSALVARAAATQAEVVLFGWTRDYEDGRVIAGAGRDILANAPERFSAAEYPRILHLLQIACNKLIRRDFLDSIGLRFVDGWYEDTPFTYPLLVAARSLTTLPMPLLRYRQRAEAITRTRSNRHVEVLGQWDRAMQHVGELAKDLPSVRTHLFPQMIRHCTSVLLKHDRVPRSSHRVFADELRRLYRRYRPPEGYRAMGRLDRLQHGLLQFASPALLRAHWRLTALARGYLHSGPEELS
jgi:CDP-glycerol glycerophosphotransferase